KLCKTTRMDNGSSQSSDSEEGEFEEKPLYPVAPTFNIEAEGVKDVSASPAFKCLDE
ncbi:hypothetical protein NDU88_002190, partial [Pleurodeles waltl]